MSLTGILSSRRSLLYEAFGYGASLTYPEFIEALDLAEKDESVNEIQIYIDSPGGEAAGTDDAAVALAVTSKPTTVLAGGTVASAAYYIASQADRIVASPGSMLGSIGVAVDTTVFDEEVSITSSNAPNKRPDLKTEEGRAVLQAELDQMESLFIQRVADGRGVSTKDVKSKFGKGGSLIASEALKAGMIDGIVERKAVVKDNYEDEEEEKAGNKPDKEDEEMDLKSLKTDHPAVYAEAVAEGVTKERERIASFNSYIEADPDNAKLKQVAQEGILSGKTVDEVRPQLDVALRDGKKTDLENDNAPEISPQASDAVASLSDNASVNSEFDKFKSKLPAVALKL